MELGLSLGSDASRFLENKTQKSQQKSGMKNGCRDFCMGLSLNSCAVENLEREESQKSQENDEDEDDDGDEEISEGDGSHYNHGETAPLQLNLLPLAPLPRRISNLPWSSDNGSSENGSSGNMGVAAAKGLDVNRTPAAAEEVSSANSVGEYGMYRSSGGNGNLSKREFAGAANDVVEGERGSDDDENGAPNRKKLRLSKEQSAFLEESFKERSTLNPKQKLALAKQLNLRPRQVEVWFQNRRARTKLKQTEVDCEYLKKCCETLREENRRLQKELHELRALKTSNPFYMQLPATTLTMCPSCERVATAPAPPPRRSNSNEIVHSTTSAPMSLNRSRFYPFSQTPNQPS